MEAGEAYTIHARVSAGTRHLIDSYAEDHGMSRSAAAAHMIERGIVTLRSRGYGANCCGGRLFGFCSASAVHAGYPLVHPPAAPPAAAARQ